tara:strand:+ start:1459 stop:1866 length:408 start_codon:yes stop_codon:yes gene_type:complete
VAAGLVAALRPADQVALVALFGFRHYLYPFWPQDQMGDVYGIGASVCLIALLLSTGLWWWFKAWAIGEELLTAGCSAAWLAWPEWFTHAFADERCSQVIGFKIGSIGLVCLALITQYVNLATCAGDKPNGRSENE